MDERGHPEESETTARPRRLGGAFLLKAVFSAGLIVWLGMRFEWGAVLTALRALAWPIPLLAWLTVLAALSLWPLRLEVLLRAQSVSSGYLPLLRITFVGLFLGNFLPSSMGGDAVKLGMLLRRHPGRRARATLSLIADRLSNILATLLLLAAVIVVPGLLSPGLDAVGHGLRALVASALAGVVGFALVFRWLQGWLRRVHRDEPARHWRERAIQLAHAAVLVISNWISSPATIAAAVGLAVASALFCIGASRILAAGLGISITWPDLIAIQGMLSVIGILPVSLNGLGVQEVSLVWLLVRLGVAPELGLAFALLNRVILMAATLPGALGLLRGSPGARRA